MKLVNINGIYINPDTVVCIQDVNNGYQGQYVAVVTNAGAEMQTAEYSEAHQIHLTGVDIADVAAVLEGKVKAMPTKKKAEQELSNKIDDVLGDL